MKKKKINYDTKLVIRISKEERETIGNWAKEHGQSVSELTRQYFRTLRNGGNR